MDAQIFSLNSGQALADRVARCLGVTRSAHEERSFEDGEHKIRPTCSVRGADVYVVQSLGADRSASVDDKLVRTLFLIGALRDAGAARVTAVIPYLCYARKDQRSKARDALSHQYVARFFETLGTDLFVTVDVHNRAAFENAFRIPTLHLEARWLLVDHLRPALQDTPICVVSPDAGGIKRAMAFADALESRIGKPLNRAFVEKYRSEGVVSGDRLIGEVQDQDVVVVDDLVSSGVTLLRATDILRAHGARRILISVTHGLFTGGLEALMKSLTADGLWVTDTVSDLHPNRIDDDRRLARVSCAELIADAIRRLHEDRSVSGLAQAPPEGGLIQTR